MALVKRTYVDGETVITAQNLNDIQDEIIAQGNSIVPNTRTINGKALTTNITLTASDVGAAPTSHATSSTTYGKGTSSNYGHVKVSDSLTDTTAASTGGTVPSMKAVSDLNNAMKRNTFAVKGTLKSNVSSSGNIFTQSTASDSRITSSSEVANVIFDSTVNITSTTVVVTPGSGTVTITGTTSSFSGTVNVVVELYNT